MIYFLLGEDEQAKSSKIAQLQKDALSAGSRELDAESLHAPRLDPVTLKQSLIALPAIAKQRFIVIHDAHKLTAANKDIVLNFSQSDHEHAVLVLESSHWAPGEDFVRKFKTAKVVDTGRAPEVNVFDMTKAIEQRRHADALKVLSELFESGAHPLQVMPPLVWFWGKKRARLSPERYEKGLLALQEADFHIKRSRLRPEQALEVLVVKLCTLIP